MCKSIIKRWLLISSVKTHLWVVFFFRVDGSTALLTLCPMLLYYFLWKEMAEIWIESEQEMSAVACHYFLRHEMSLFWISWNLHFDDVGALDYTFPYFDRCNSVSSSYYLCLFAFKRQFCSWIFFCKYPLKFFQFLYKMQVIVELPLYAFLFASLN